MRRAAPRALEGRPRPRRPRGPRAGRRSPIARGGGWRQPLRAPTSFLSSSLPPQRPPGRVADFAEFAARVEAELDEVASESRRLSARGGRAGVAAAAAGAGAASFFSVADALDAPAPPAPAPKPRWGLLPAWARRPRTGASAAPPPPSPPAAGRTRLPTRGEALATLAARRRAAAVAKIEAQRAQAAAEAPPSPSSHPNPDGNPASPPGPRRAFLRRSAVPLAPCARAAAAAPRATWSASPPPRACRGPSRASIAPEPSADASRKPWNGGEGLQPPPRPAAPRARSPARAPGPPPSSHAWDVARRATAAAPDDGWTPGALAPRSPCARSPGPAAAAAPSSPGPLDDVLERVSNLLGRVTDTLEAEAGRL